jgi:ParB family transcriptional regulator, chromosome partitioning protein
MQLRHIDIANLTVSAANMRGKGKADIANILPSVRTRGILVPLMVRPNGSPDTFEIVAGKRRYHAALAVAEENGGESEPLPCAVLEDADDAAALEASLIENVARLDPDEVTRWETFTRLVKEGRSPENIALTFGLTDLQVKRTLALGNLLPRIRNLYRDEKIDAVNVRHLTLASKAQQREWLKMLDNPNAYCPTGSQLKAWLFGGASIPTSAAIFDLATYEGELVTDLFGDDSYFASADAFWAAQNAAIDAKAKAYREAGWNDVIILEPGSYFHTWEHERRPKKKGGKVFIAVGHRGEVTVHEGYVSRREARRQEQAEGAGEKPKRPEITAPIQNYIDLHRHAVVRSKVAGKPMLALRLALAHAIVGSALWNVRIEPQRALTDAIAESVETCPSEAVFDVQRRAVLTTLRFDAEAPTLANGYAGDCGIAGLFMRLLSLPDEVVLEALAIIMAETLEAGTPLIETLGRHLQIDMADAFVVDGTLLDLIKDREVLDAMVADLAGQQAADANTKASGKVKRQIIADCLNGTNGRAKVERFVPKWMAFPPGAYTPRGGVQTVSRAAAVECLFRPAKSGNAPEEGTNGAARSSMEALAEQPPAVDPEPVAQAA